MGFYKNLEIQLSGEGIDIHSYLTIGNKMVCYHCFEDYAIKILLKKTLINDSVIIVIAVLIIKFQFQYMK